MLEDGNRLVKPETIAKQIPWEKFEAVVVLGLGKHGEQNELWMSTLTINELSFLMAHLQSHLTHLMGPMKEGC